ncbi:MAG: Asp/Glu racemase [Gammaproteobacteria bacterium]|nr:Asp/Glu racemase [Gammaproteobacteria bacterium]
MVQAATEVTEHTMISRTHIPFDVDAGVAARAAIGVIVLATDQTIEFEFRQLLNLPGVGFFESRILNDNTVTPDTLRAMEARLTDSANLILPGQPLDVVAFGCTSASMVIGEQQVFARLREAQPDAKFTTPITAAMAAFDCLGAKRLAVLTPYRDDVNQAVRKYIEDRGYRVTAFGSFNEEDDGRAARIDQKSIRAAAIDLGQRDDVDMVFVSCTSLRLAGIAAEIETAIGKPVSSSNHAMAWHCLRLAGVADRQPAFGQLFADH